VLIIGLSAVNDNNRLQQQYTLFILLRSTVSFATCATKT